MTSGSDCKEKEKRRKSGKNGKKTTNLENSDLNNDLNPGLNPDPTVELVTTAPIVKILNIYTMLSCTQL